GNGRRVGPFFEESGRRLVRSPQGIPRAVRHVSARGPGEAVPRRSRAQPEEQQNARPLDLGNGGRACLRTTRERPPPLRLIDPGSIPTSRGGGSKWQRRRSLGYGSRGRRPPICFRSNGSSEGSARFPPSVSYLARTRPAC